MNGDIWGAYQNRMNIHGSSKRDAVLKREKRMLNNRVPDSLSYQEVTVFGQDYGYNISSDEALEMSVLQSVAIINSDNMNEKLLCSLPGEDIELGSLIHWEDNYWIVNERDVNTTVYTRAKMIQCNYLLKWVTDEDEICEQWCVVEDGTKLEHIYVVCNGLAYWKRYAKRILLIAGTPLETYSLQRGFEIKASATALKEYGLGNQQPSSEQEKVQRLSRTWE